MCFVESPHEEEATGEVGVALCGTPFNRRDERQVKGLRRRFFGTLDDAEPDGQGAVNPLS